MMSLESKDLADISTEDITGLLGTPESLHLDFKECITLDDSGKAELLKDIVAMANAEGGHLILGIREDDNSCAETIIPIKNAATVCSQIRDICADRIERRLAGLQSRPIQTSDGDVIVVRIPNEDPKPHWIRMKGSSVRIPKRFGDGTRAMTLDEVIDAVLGDRVIRTLDEVAAHIKALEVSHLTPPQKPGELTASQLVRVTDVSKFRLEMDAMFTGRIGEDPTYRLTLLPVPLQEDLPLYKAFDKAIELVRNPPRPRDHGWDLQPTDEPKVEELGVSATSQLSDGGLRILYNGFCEFWANTQTDHFQWAYTNIKQPRPFFLDPHAIIEPIVCLVRLAERVCELLSDVESVEVTAEFWNCSGAKLIKYPPETHGHRMALGFAEKPLLSGYIGELTDNRISTPPRAIACDELRDGTARDLVRDVYRLFSHVDVEIPYFSEDGSFTLNG